MPLDIFIMRDPPSNISLTLDQNQIDILYLIDKFCKFNLLFSYICLYLIQIFIGISYTQKEEQRGKYDGYQYSDVWISDG